jgi:rhomboid protease GluP
VNSPIETPNADGYAKYDAVNAAYAEVSTVDDSHERIREDIGLRDRRIAEFHNRLFELTPRALIVRAIVVANVFLFALMAVSTKTLLSPGSDALLAWGANAGPETLDGQWWRLLTSMFVHIGIIHIAFNMWMLCNVGHLVERLVGNVGFLVLYLISGLSGSVASVFWNPHANSAGASGAVFGVFGALFGFMVLRRDSVPSSFLVRLRGSGLTFLAINLAVGYSIDGIDNAAHVGGLVAGFVCGVLMSQPLSRANKTSRAMRNLLTAAVGAVALLATLHFAPDAPIDVEAAQREVMETYTVAYRRWEVSEVTSDAFAELIESKILPKWRKVREAVGEMRNLEPKQKQLLEQYVKAYEEEWEAHVARLRDPTNENVSRHEETRKKVARLVEKLNRQ